MLASRILIYVRHNHGMHGRQSLLLRVISRIGEDPGVKTTQNLINTFDDYAVFPSFNELIINQDVNLGMKAFTTTMSEERFPGTFPANMLGCEVRELVR
jgi:hypothetical protein